MEWLPLGLFGASLVVFHSSELIFVWIFTPGQLSFGSLLLSKAYILAMLSGVLEFVLESYFLPGYKQVGILPGVFIILMGEAVRKCAMVYAKGSFTHKLAVETHPTNLLIVDGPYRYCRHPGYLGWAIWALGTQVLLANPLCLAIFAIVIWRFFQARIAYEEQLLIHHFGMAYIEYKAKTPTLMLGID